MYFLLDIFVVIVLLNGFVLTIMGNQNESFDDHVNKYEGINPTKQHTKIIKFLFDSIEMQRQQTKVHRQRRQPQQQPLHQPKTIFTPTTFKMINEYARGNLFCFYHSLFIIGSTCFFLCVNDIAWKCREKHMETKRTPQRVHNQRWQTQNNGTVTMDSFCLFACVHKRRNTLMSFEWKWKL